MDGLVDVTRKVRRALSKEARFGGGRHVVKQTATKHGIKSRGRLSGEIARTERGKEINQLEKTAIVVSANNVTGQVGPWFLNRKGQ